MQNTDILKCPVCDLPIYQMNGSFVCDQKHNFDIAKEGYLNLLLASQKKSKSPGDNKAMVVHRRDFLNKGYYNKLLETIYEMVYQNFLNDLEKIPDKKLKILDLGCGEGYYIFNLRELINQVINDSDYYGIDISKDAVLMASKRSSEVNFVVGNAFFSPFADNTFDIIFSIFSPLSENEVKRILKDNSIIIIVGPGNKHLFEFIELIYDKPKSHEFNNKLNSFDGFKILDERLLNYRIELDNKDDITNLFAMTPYYWQPSEEKQNKILSLNKLNIQIDFKITIFQKK